MSMPSVDQDEVLRQRVQQMRDDELLNFVRNTAQQLNVLANRLESIADRDEGESIARANTD